MLKMVSCILAMACLVFTGCSSCDTRHCHQPAPQVATEVRIADMKPGESGWTVPWGMFADARGQLWLRKNYLVRSHPGGTAQMLVMRTADGYLVDIGESREKWARSGEAHNAVRVMTLLDHPESNTAGGAVLPEVLRQRAIDDLAPGQSGWVVPWSMVADADGKLWLYTDAYIYERPGGTVEMKVVRTAGGYTVDISRTDHKWERRASKPDNGARVMCIVGFPANNTTDGATLPNERRQFTVSDMTPGSQGWIVSWGMYTDEQGRYMLNGGHTVSQTGPGGTCRLLVKRTATGYSVDRSYLNQFSSDAVSPGRADVPIPIIGIRW